MTTRKTSELTGPALDWAVAKCEGIDPYINKVWIGTKHCYAVLDPDKSIFRSSTDWAQGGPIIERDGIRLHRGITNLWWAATEADPHRPVSAPTPLVAAMRVYVLSRVGAEIDVPEELIETSS